MLKHRAFTLAAFASLGLLVGCGDYEPKQPAKKEKQKEQTQPADPHDVPMTEQEKQQLKESIKDYRDALARIKAYRDTIRKEATQGTPAKAHRSLDELDWVLELLPEVAQQSGVPKEKLEEVTTASTQLRDLFNKVHEKIDNKQPPDYPAVADDIEAEIKELETIAGETSKG